MKINYQLPAKYIWPALMLLLSASAVAQTKISGRVTEENGQPLPGATVREKGTTNGTTTDVTGSFTLPLRKRDASLTVTMMGYIGQEVSAAGKTSLSFSLKSDKKDLGEVVVVGYGTQKKVNLTGAVTQIDSRLLENRPVTNALAALQGAAAGVTLTRTTGQPGSEGYAVQIRGRSSVNGSEPLVIIDGSPGSTAHIALLNPNDIESVSVLKDAAAAAIYGARAANGVILVTTKKGNEGKTTVSYNGLYGTQKPVNRPNKLHSWREAEMENEARTNAGQSEAWTAQQIEWMKDPDINYVVDPTNPSMYQYYYDIDNIGLVFRDQTPMQSHDISVSGGTKKDNYYASLGYYEQQGIFKLGPDKTDRINARLNYSRQFTDKISLDTRIAYRQGNTLAPSHPVQGNGGLLYLIYTRGTMEPVYLPGSNDEKYAASWVGLTTPAGTYSILKEGGRNATREDNLTAVISLKAADIVKGLTLRAIYSPGLSVSQNDVNVRTIPYWNITGINDYGYQKSNPNSISKKRATTTRNNMQLLGDYDLALNSRHTFHLLGGFSFEDYRFDYTTATAKGLSSNDLFALNLGDPALASNTDDIQTWALLSYFGRLNYSFDNRFLFEADLRYDGSSKLAPGHRWQLFPAVSAGWRLNNEKWFHSALPFFDEFKLRASWGQLGNSEGVLGNYDYIAPMALGSVYPFNNQRNKSFYQSVLASPEKTWETVETSNAGVDISLFKQRLSLSGDYFVKQNKNMLAPLQLASMIGIATSTYNVATMKTWGWEVTLGWKDALPGNFNYWINANLSDNNNKILSYNGKSTVLAGLNGIVEGMPYSSFFGYTAQGYFQQEDEVAKHAFQDNRTGAGDIIYKDINGDGRINAGKGTMDDHGDLVYLGNIAPRYTYGFDLGFNWKGIDVSAFFQGVGKRKMMPFMYSLLPLLERWRKPLDYNEDYWTPENPDARFPRLYLGGTQNALPSTHWIMNAAYLRLKNLQVGYTLPASLTMRAKIQKARIYFSGQDLWEISQLWLKHLDPEIPNNADFQYPFFRTFSFGVNLTL